MIRVSMEVTDKGVRTLLVNLTGTLENPRGLNAALAARLAEELKDHFGTLNARPNRMQAPKTNFWQSVANSVAEGEITDSGAVVHVAEHRYRIHLFGGTIKPTAGRKFLTIPLIPEARGMRYVKDYEHKSGNKLFRVGRVLMEKSDQPARTMPGGVKVRTNVTFLGPVGQVRAVFALKRSVTIPKDPDAFPPAAKLVAALQEQADDFITAELARKGGAS